MTLIIILITIVLQRFMKFHSYSHQVDWASHYFQWMNSKFKQITSGHGLLGTAILVLPILLITGIAFGIVYGVLGLIGSGILELALFWYVSDARDYHKESDDMGTAEHIFQNSYQKLFANMFWYGLLGPVGLLLYVSVSQLSLIVPKTITSATESNEEQLQIAEQTQSGISLHESLLKVLGVLDWVPVRLLGLAFALVGNFGVVFKLWMQKLSHGIKDTQALVFEWGNAALKLESDSGESSLKPAINLVDRSLLVWLVVIFLLTIGTLVG